MSVVGNTPAGVSRPVVEASQPLLRAAQAVAPATQSKQISAVDASNSNSNDSGQEFVRVTSSIGRAASAGQLSRQEALDIYRQIASFL